MAENLITVAQAAQQLGLADITVRTWIAQRRVGFVKLGRAVRIPQSEITRLIEHNLVPAKVA